MMNEQYHRQCVVITDAEEESKDSASALLVRLRPQADQAAKINN